MPCVNGTAAVTATHGLSVSASLEAWSNQTSPLRTSNHHIPWTEHSNCPNGQPQPLPYRVKGSNSGLEIPPIATLETSTPPYPPKILYKPCPLLRSLLFLRQAEAATIMGLPPTSPPKISCMRFVVRCDFVVFHGSRWSGYLSIQSLNYLGKPLPPALDQSFNTSIGEAFLLKAIYTYSRRTSGCRY